MSVNMTRPEYLLKFLQDDLDLETLKKVFPDSYELIYCSYNVLQKLRDQNDLDIHPEDILSAVSDSESMSVGIEFSNKKLAKQVKDCSIKTVRGVRGYTATLEMKGKGTNVFFMFEIVPDDW